MEQAEQLIKSLNLFPHPEGGYYKRNYASETIVNTSNGNRPSCTMIHYLLKNNDQSVFHRLKSDEIWMYQIGCTIIIHSIDSDGHYSKDRLGMDSAKNDKLQIIVRAGTWFAAELESKDKFALCTCVVSPGFDFKDFEIADKKTFMANFPQHSSLINQFTR